MPINPKLCQHVWKYAFNFTTAGTMRPDQVIVLYCSKCADIKTKIAPKPKK